MTRVAFLILTLLVTSCPVVGAKTIDLDAATIADINARLQGRYTDRGGLGPTVPRPYPQL